MQTEAACRKAAGCTARRGVLRRAMPVEGTVPMRRRMLLSVGVLLMTTPALSADFVALPSGVRIRDDVVGDGAGPKSGQTVTVHYTGWLDDGGKPGRKFDSSRDRGAPFSFVLDGQQVISGWDIGVATMKIGGRRTLIIPPQHGYGARGAGGVIPPNATLMFDVELLGIR